MVTMTIPVKRLLFASVVRFPDRHDRNRSCGMVPVLPAGPSGLAVVLVLRWSWPR